MVLGIHNKPLNHIEVLENGKRVSLVCQKYYQMKINGMR
jgi:hypothetical protein